MPPKNIIKAFAVGVIASINRTIKMRARGSRTHTRGDREDTQCLTRLFAQSFTSSSGRTSERRSIALLHTSHDILIFASYRVIFNHS